MFSVSIHAHVRPENTHVDCILKTNVLLPESTAFNFVWRGESVVQSELEEKKRGEKPNYYANDSISLLFGVLPFLLLISNSVNEICRTTNCFFLNFKCDLKTVNPNRSRIGRWNRLRISVSQMQAVSDRWLNRKFTSHSFILAAFSLSWSFWNRVVFSFFRFNYTVFNTDWIVNFWIELSRSYSSNLIGIFSQRIRPFNFMHSIQCTALLMAWKRYS